MRRRESVSKEEIWKKTREMKSKRRDGIGFTILSETVSQ